MENNVRTASSLASRKRFKLSEFLGSWEMMLVYILLIINIVLMTQKTELYFAEGTIQAIIQSSLDLSFMVLGMVFVLMLGDIDVSIAANMIASASALGLIYQSSGSALLALAGGLVVGVLCGLFNGFLIAFVGIPAVIVTISSSMVFRGIVQIVLGVNSLKDFPDWMSQLSWGNIAGIPIILIFFLLATVVFGLVLQRSSFGRKLYIIGNNKEAARYSGINVVCTKLLVFGLMGLMSAISAFFFIGRFGGVSSTMAVGYDLDVIAIAVLGGISTSGGKGRIYGPFIAALVMEFLFYALGLFGVEANTRKIITGVVLLVAVLIPSIRLRAIYERYLKIRFRKHPELIELKRSLDKENKRYNERILDIKADEALSEVEKNKKIAELVAKREALSVKYESALRKSRRS